MCTPEALLRMQFGMEGQESMSNTQEAKKTRSAYRPMFYKVQSRSHENSSSPHRSALMLLTLLSSLRMPCPSCSPFSQIVTITPVTYLLLLPLLQKLCSHPAADSLPQQRAKQMGQQRRARQKSKWTGLPATLK